MPAMHAHSNDAWQLFKQLAESNELEHDGDPELAAHVAAAQVHITATGPRIRKPSDGSGKIDALAAAVLAVSRCDLKTNPVAKRPSVFWMELDGTRADADVGETDSAAE
jgi:phage terminase large subunit-like protein